MARKRTYTYELPDNIEVEVIAIKEDKVIKKVMPYVDFLNMKRKTGWTYTAYQKGYSQFKTTE